MSCAIEGKLEHKLSPRCENFLSRIEMIIFSDYRLIGDFAEACKADIEGNTCGSVSRKVHSDSDQLMFHHSQGTVIRCLLENSQSLTPECKAQTFRIAELQSDDYHLDRALFFACKDDREAFCGKITSGEGRVYSCLTENMRVRHFLFDVSKSRIYGQKLQINDIHFFRKIATQHCKNKS